MCQLLEPYYRRMKHTCLIHCVNYYNCLLIKQIYHRHCINYQNCIVDKSNKPIIDTVLTIRTVLQPNQTDLSQTLLEQYCRQIKETYHRHCVNYQNCILDKSNRSIIGTIGTVLQIYHRHCVNYQIGIAEKSDKPILDTLLTIRTVLQTNETYMSYTLCYLLNRYCRQIKETFHRHCVNYQNDIVDISNKLIIDNVPIIRTLQQTNQTDLAETLC